MFGNRKQAKLLKNNENIIQSNSPDVTSMALALLSDFHDLYANEYKEINYYFIEKRNDRYFVLLGQTGFDVLVASPEVENLIKIAQKTQLELGTIYQPMLSATSFEKLNETFDEQYNLACGIRDGTHKLGTLAKKKREQLGLNR
ncbi:MAG: hypothetical protein IJ301_01890 [Clostridia bacterium]|nr:hypothetical protein [Clostridia bacterium]